LDKGRACFVGFFFVRLLFSVLRHFRALWRARADRKKHITASLMCYRCEEASQVTGAGMAERLPTLSNEAQLAIMNLVKGGMSLDDALKKAQEMEKVEVCVCVCVPCGCAWAGCHPNFRVVFTRFFLFVSALRPPSPPV
jgi:hypothetical protein